MSSDYNPVQFLEEIAFFDGINNIMSTYRSNTKLLEEGYDYQPDQDNYVKFDLIEYPDSDNADFVATTIDRGTFFQKHLETNKKELINYLKNIQKDSDFEENLKVIYNSLHAVITKTNDSNLQYQEILENFLITLIQDLKTLFQTIETHKVFRFLNKSQGFIAYFQYKDLKASFFEDLYEVTYKLDLIDDVEISEESFYDVLTASDPNPENHKIVFSAKNHLIAFYLKEIEPFFNNLNAVSIERSRCFYNKQGKLLTSTDLYTSLSRNKDKDTETLKKISYHINELKLAYLK